MAAVAGGIAASSSAAAFIAPSRDGDGERHARPGDVAIRFGLGGSAASAAAAGRPSRPEVSLGGQRCVAGLAWSAALAVAARSARRRGAGDGGSSARGTRSRRAAAPRPQPGQKVVGIDLGTTTSVVATLELNEPRVVPNAEGERVTPSVVAFTKERELLVGTVAKRQAVMNPLNTFHSVKRFIGRTPVEVKEEVKHFPYTVADAEGRKVELECPNLGRNLAPEEVSAHVLRKLKQDAEEYLRATIEHAVITVPAYFNDSQRHATRDAGRIAGLEVMRIANEPTMAALAYGLDQTNNSFIMVLDLGGGTFDVSLLEIGDGVVEVGATGGDTHLGGNDFDQRIVDWLAESFKEKEGIDLREDKQALQRLTEAAERAKTELSTLAETRISVPFVAADENGPKHVEEVLTVEQFEGMCVDLMERISTTIRQVIRDAGLKAKDLNQVVFVGGSSRIPMFQNLAREETLYKPLNHAVNPEEVVALGAAVNAAMLAGEVEDIMLLDVTPLTLGVETNGGVFTPVIERNTGIPVKQVKLFTTSEDSQDEIEVVVLQGERQFAESNKKLGSFRLSGLPPAPAGVPKIEVAFEIGLDGILTVTAKDWATRRKESIKVYNASTLEEWEVDKILEDVEMHWASDEQKREDVDLVYSAERLVMQSTEMLLELGDRVPVDTQMAVREKISNLEEAIAIEEKIELTSLKQLVQDTRFELMKAGPRVWGNQLAPDGRPGPAKKRLGGGVTGSGSTSEGIDKYPDGKEPPSWVQTPGWKQKAAKVDAEFDAKLQAKKAEAASKPTGPAMPA